MEEVREQFYVVKGNPTMLDADTKPLFIGLQETEVGFTALFEGHPSLFDEFGEEIIIENATLEDMMFFMTRKEL